jgi:cytidylate kinase
MNAALERTFSFVNSHTVPGHHAAEPRVRRSVTISRQAGCGAMLVAEKLAQYLQLQTPHDGVKWTVFNREFMIKVLADHDLPEHLLRFLPEDRVSRVEDALAELFGVHPAAKTILEQAAETMLQLAGMGGAILVGRAANIVTAKLPNVLHVRLVAPLDDRIERICHEEHKTLEEARRFCIEKERARERYVKSYFHADTNDPLLYHMVINTSRLGHENAARLIGDAVMHLKG